MTLNQARSIQRWPVAAAYALAALAIAEFLVVALSLWTGAARARGDEGWEAHLFQLGFVWSLALGGAVIAAGGWHGPSRRPLAAAALIWAAAIATAASAGL